MIVGIYEGKFMLSTTYLIVLCLVNKVFNAERLQCVLNINFYNLTYHRNCHYTFWYRSAV